MEEREVLVKVEGISKKFCKDLRTSLWYGMTDLFKNLKGNQAERKLRAKEFWALKDIDFELRRGECLGLIGHNGAGKSTLLKILNGLIKPDQGRVTIKGRVGALIELGAGFNPILSGKENIYNNGAVLGFSRKEIDEKIEDIIDFAEVREFIDMPVQNYSSGMRIRLGFAVAAQMQPDVLLIDEVLAVGDLGFILKCYKIIDTILPRTAIIFVSHSMPLVSRICNKIILLESGECTFEGRNIGKGIDNYYNKFSNNNEVIMVDDGSLSLLMAMFENDQYEKTQKIEINWLEDLRIFLKIRFRRSIELPLLRLIIYDQEQRPVAIIEDNLMNKELQIVDDILEFCLIHKKVQFSKGIFSIDLAFFKACSNTTIFRINNFLSFQVIHEVDVWPPFLLQADYEDRRAV